MRMLIIHALVLGLFISNIVLAHPQYRHVELGVTQTCSACKEAETMLDEAHIKYTTVVPSNNSHFVPQLYVDGKYLGSGTDIVKGWLDSK